MLVLKPAAAFSLFVVLPCFDLGLTVPMHVVRFVVKVTGLHRKPVEDSVGFVGTDS